MKQLIFKVILLVSIVLFSGNCSGGASSGGNAGDTTAPAAPSAPNLDAADDSGVSSTDNITNVTTALTFTGTAEAGSTVQLYKNGVAVGTPVTATGGNYSIDVDITTNGTFAINADATDSAGNRSVQSTQSSVTIDTNAPSTPTGFSMTTDTGISTTDGITKDSTPSFSFNAVIGADTYYAYVDGVATNTNGYTTASFTLTTLQDGAHSITLKAGDIAGNSSLETMPLSITIDTIVPLAPTIPDLDPLDDSGVSNSDNITNLIDFLTFNGTAETGSTVTLYKNTTNVGAAIATNGNYSIDITIISNNSYTMTATTTDVAGNISVTSTAMTLTIDTSITTPSLPDLIATDDSGISSTDNKTNVTAYQPFVTFTGTAAAGTSVQLIDNNTLVNIGLPGVTDAAGTWTIQVASINFTDGVYSVRAVATDIAGNISNLSGTLNLTIDTLMTTPTGPNLAAADDTGQFNNDGITKNSTALTFSGTSDPSVTLQLYANGVPVDLSFNSTTSGTWSKDLTLVDGTYQIKAIASDIAGNISLASPGFNLTVDTTAPQAPTIPDLDPLDDSGVSNTDNITNLYTAMTFNGTAEIGSTVKLYKNGFPLSTNLYTGTGNGVAANGAYSIDISFTFSSAAYTITALTTDVAGNQSALSTAMNVTVDTTTPVAPALPDLIALHDTGTSSTDNITNATLNNMLITFTGTATAGDQVQLYNATTNSTLGLPVIADATGIWISDVDSLVLVDGSYNIKAKAIDTAGNISGYSTGFILTMDTTISVPSIPDLVAADDLGISNTDNITNLTTGLTFSGTADAGSSVQLYVDGIANGTPVTPAGGNWSKDLALATQATPYSVTATATDTAGNSAISLPLSLTINSATGPATTPSAPDLIAVDDTGTSNTDNITNLTTALTFVGTGIVGSYVQLFINGLVIGPAATVDGAGNWSIDIDLPAGGTYAISAKNVDIAGNAGSPSLGINITVDNTISISVPDLSAASDTGFSSTDNITALTTGIMVSGTCTISDSVQINIDTVATGAPIICATTSWSTNLTLASGATYSVTATGTDIAGNTMTTSPLSITVDSNIPTITSALTMDADGDGYIDHYKITLSRNVIDASFPGYVLNSIGNPQYTWLLSNYANVRLAHGTAAPEPDTVDDTIIYLKFSEGPVPDTGNKPDITTTASPMFGSINSAINQILTGTVTETDSAKPVLAQAQSQGETIVRALYSEAVFATAAETLGNYLITGLNISGAVMQAGAGMNSDAVLLTTTPQTYGIDNYTLVAATGVITGLDNLVLASPKNTALFSGFESLLRLVAIGGNGQVTLSWTPPTGMTSYNLYWGTSPGVTVASATAAGKKITGVTSGYVHSPLTNGTPYYYILTGVSGASESAPSREVKGIPAVYGNTFSIYSSMISSRRSHKATRLSDGTVLITGGFNKNGASLSTAEIYDPLTKTFSATTGNMTIARYYHTATLLTDGKVLVTGGNSAGLIVSTAEIYDPVAKTFSPTTGNMARGRTNHTATLLVDGTVLITGGTNGSFVNNGAEIYDPVTKTFSATTGGMASARYLHCATLLVDGTVLITGGNYGGFSYQYINIAEIYNPVSKTFSTTTGSMSTARAEHSATLLADGTVIINGGISNGYMIVSTAEIYDPGTKTFSSITGVMGRDHTNTLLSDGKLLLTGGHTNYSAIYDPVTKTFSTTIGLMVNERTDHTATLLADGTVLITGGWNTTSSVIDVTSTSEIYNPLLQTFSLTKGMTTEKAGHTATLLDNGNILITGGVSKTSTSLYKAELYDPATNSISGAQAMLIARVNHTATRLNDGRVLILGGLGTGGLNLASGEIYNPVTNTFSNAGNITASYNFEDGLVPAGFTGDWTVNNATSSEGAYSMRSAVIVDSQTSSVQFTATTQTSTISFNCWVSSDPSDLLFFKIDDTLKGIWGGTWVWSRVSYPVTAGTHTFTWTYSKDNSFSAWSDTVRVDNIVIGQGINMSYARNQHTATLLNNGKVLIVGGSGSLTSAEIYDPVTGVFTAAASLANGRYGHTATLMADGRVMIAGGFNGTVSLSTAEIYDPDTNTFSLPISMASARYGHSAILLPNGKVLISGGRNGATYHLSSEIYDPATNAFSPSANMATARASHNAVMLANGKVLIAGGTTGAMETTSAEIFDPITNTYSSVPGGLNIARSDFSSLLLNNGKVFLSGGVNGTTYLQSYELFQ